MIPIRPLTSICLGASLVLATRADTAPRPAAPDATTPCASATAPGKALTSAQAVAHWTERTAAQADNAEAWVNLGNALMQQSRERPQEAFYEQAETAFRRALALATNHTDALVGLAWVHNARHEFDQGDRFARQALAIDPRLQHAHALLGDAAVERGDYDSAYEHFQEALDLRPDLSSYSRSAQLLWLTGDARKARWLMQKAVAAGGPHAENTAWCQAELALMTFQTGVLLAAEQEIESAVKIAPSNHHVLAVAGRIKAARKDYDGARQLFLRSVALTPTHEALAALVDLATLQGRPDEASQHARRLIDFHAAGTIHSHDGGTQVDAHPHPHGNAQLARFYADHDRDLDIALREATAAYETSPNVFVADTLAWCLFKKGQFKEAERMIRKALKWNTPNAEMHFHAGLIYARLNKRPLAQKHLYQALSLNPQFHPVFAQTAADTLKTLAPQTADAKSGSAPANP